MARTSVQYSKWMITIDGVQVPWVQFTVKTGVDFPGQASITLEPDQILSRMRPKSMVHIWMYDEYVDTENIEDRYFLFWEGEVRGTSYSKIPARSYNLSATGCLATLDNHKIFMSGVGDITGHPIINGSALFGELAAAPLFTFAITGGMFDKNMTGGRDPKEDTPYRHSNEINFADRILKMIVYFCQYNALLRLHTVRSRILNKIAYIPDKTMGFMIPHILASDFFKDVGEQVSPQDSLLGLINRYNSYVFYHYVSMTAPHFPEDQPPGGFDLVSEPGKDPTDSIYSIARDYYRNDYLLVPETFYAIPPACNLIFPEYIQHISVGRDFLSEPTRAIITDHTLGSKLSVVVPDDILRFKDEPVEPADFWTFTNTKKIDPNNPPQSPYIVPGTNINLLGAATDDEIEKGIIPWMVTQPMYLFNAVARDFELDEASREDIKDRLGTILRLAPLMETGGQSKENQQRAFVYTMKLIADFTLQLNRLRRSVSVNLEGHRWLCPGFPTVILDTDISYIGWVKDHTFIVDQEGSESSSVSLDYVRPMPTIDKAKLDEIVRTTGESERKIENGVKALDDRYDDFQRERAVDFEIARAAFRSTEEEWEEWNRTGRNGVIGDGWRSFENQFKKLDVLYMASIRKPAPQNLQAESDGALDLSELKAVYDQVEVFFPLTGAEVSNQDEALRVSALSKKMNKVLKDFYDYEQKRIEEIKEIGEQGVPNIATLGDASLMRSKTALEALYDNLEAATDPPEDYPYPPVFANQSIMGVTEAEEVYEKVLGAQKIFTEISEEIKEPSLSGSTGGLEGFRRKAYAKYAHFLRVLGSIFPVTSPRAPEMDTGSSQDPKQTESNQTEWEKESARDDSLDSVRKWEDRRFLRRTGLMSLGQFIKTNGLELQRINSDPPTPTSFIVLAPVKTRDVGGLAWDNTIFSKIIDEFEDVPRIDQPYVSDPKIKELRESVKDPFLTTLYRQARMVKYSKKHFGSRGFDGS